MTIIDHQLLNKDFNNPHWEIKHLFIGTFNPTGGHPVKYFYGRESNYFWKVISNIFSDDLNPIISDSTDKFIKKLQNHQIACLDLINSVEFDEAKVDIQNIIGKGYSDSKIINKKVKRNYNAKFINKIIEKNPNIKVYTTWGNGSNFREWKDEINKLPKDIIKLVSPSRVARVPLGVKKFEYILKNWKQNIKF